MTKVNGAIECDVRKGVHTVKFLLPIKTTEAWKIKAVADFKARKKLNQDKQKKASSSVSATGIFNDW